MDEVSIKNTFIIILEHLSKLYLYGTGTVTSVIPIDLF